MHYVVLCIGSNVAQAQANITDAVERLTAQSHGTIVRASTQYVVNQPYANQVVLLATPLDYPTLHALTKSIERAMGRTPDLKALGTVPIDIDIILYDGALMRAADYTVPYFRQGYRQVISDEW